ncbi:agmatine deiminase family protein [Phycicoccus sp. BSK3Z-2]|uniref:Agmatine deiminase family protein n=2 Tax=Phycicoccus avicenniae TaxID=2828860 RepID=A0A941DB65_9MICO|nr:agmatine deiminase family protein [Phycicoccus avicenniae]MBR7744468.1 agmatine deiminase family protein [Phycicoccus avicenniae]
MPAEWSRHRRTWIAWPTGGHADGVAAEDLAEARTAWATVVRAVALFEPVTLVADPADVADARRSMRGGPTAFGVDVVSAALDDAWMRDTGPTFVLGRDGRLGAVDWVFQGWGGQDWAVWEHDRHLASAVADRAGAERVPSPLVAEGGALHVDGAGTVLLTESVLLDPARNPGLVRADVEDELARTVGATTCVWLPRGLTADHGAHGTRGHVDLVAAFAAPGTVLLHWQPDPAHPDHAVSLELEGLLSGARDVRGVPLEVVRVPAPSTLEDGTDWVSWSYVSHAVVNGGVVAPAFDDARDREAHVLLRRLYDGRRVVGVDARAVFDRGGGLHSVTQQEPEERSG